MITVSYHNRVNPPCSLLLFPQNKEKRSSTKKKPLSRGFNDLIPLVKYFQSIYIKTITLNRKLAKSSFIAILCNTHFNPPPPSFSLFISNPLSLRYFYLLAKRTDLNIYQRVPLQSKYCIVPVL